MVPCKSIHWAFLAAKISQFTQELSCFIQNDHHEWHLTDWTLLYEKIKMTDTNQSIYDYTFYCIDITSFETTTVNHACHST